MVARPVAPIRLTLVFEVLGQALAIVGRQADDI
jgi:hypothetical protein